MARRVTILLDEDILKKLRVIQAKKITQSSEHVSFSSVINETLKKSMKQS